MKRLFKSRNNRVISGVCGGIAEYFNIDPSLVRLGMVAVSIFSAGTGVVAYIIAAVVIPNEPNYPSDVDWHHGGHDQSN